MQNKFKLIIVAVAMILTGCASTTPSEPDVINNTTPIAENNITIPKVDPTKLQSVRWKLMNENDLKAYIADNKGKPYIVYVLDQDNMKIEISNIQELRRYLKDQQAKIQYLIDALKINNDNSQPAAQKK